MYCVPSSTTETNQPSTFHWENFNGGDEEMTTRQRDIEECMLHGTAPSAPVKLPRFFPGSANDSFQEVAHFHLHSLPTTRHRIWKKCNPWHGGGDGRIPDQRTQSKFGRDKSRHSNNGEHFYIGPDSCSRHYIVHAGGDRFYPWGDFFVHCVRHWLDIVVGFRDKKDGGFSGGGYKRSKWCAFRWNGERFLCEF